MKKSLSIVLVLILTAIGAEALASKLDVQINTLVSETNDIGPSSNGNSGDEGSGISRPSPSK